MLSFLLVGAGSFLVGSLSGYLLKKKTIEKSKTVGVEAHFQAVIEGLTHDKLMERVGTKQE